MVTEVGHFNHSSFTVLNDHVLIIVPGGHSGHHESGEESPAIPVPGDWGRRSEDNCSKLEVGQTVG